MAKHNRRTQRYVLVCGFILVHCLPFISGYSFVNTPPRVIRKYRDLPPNLVFDCRTTDPTSVATLLYRGRDAFNPARISQNGSVFTFKNFNGMPPGLHNYVCKSTNSQGQVIQWMTFLHLLVGVQLKVNLDRYNLVKRSGESFNITCEVTSAGVSTLNIEWQKSIGSAFVRIPADHTFAKKNALVLMFKNAPAMNQTYFKCVAKLSVPKDYKKEQGTYVHILDPVPATISHFTTDDEIVLAPDTSQDFHCAATGFPLPEIRWFKDGKELLTDNCLWNCKHRRVYEKHKAGVHDVNECLRVNDVKFPDDAGVYTCQATNGVAVLPSTRSVRAVFLVPPVLDKRIGSIVVQSDTTPTLTCTILSGYPLPRFTWTNQLAVCGQDAQKCKPLEKWQALMPGSTRQSPPSPDPTLQSNLTVSASVFSEFYRCQAGNNLGSDSHVIHLQRSKNKKPSISIKSLPDVDEGQTFSLRCNIFLGNFTSWRRDGVTLTPTEDPRISIDFVLSNALSQEVSLSVANATVNDSGVYSCHADQMIEARLKMNITSSVTVHAVYPPRITSFNNITVLANRRNKTNVLITCLVNAHPEATVTWWAGSLKLNAITEQRTCRNSLRGYYLLRGRGGDTLVICDALHEAHSGWLTCTAENHKGTDQRSAYLDILVSPRISTPKSQILRLYRGTTLNQTCVSQGNPAPVIQWYKIEMNGSVSLQTRVKEGRLLIDEMREEDFGNYSCVATNSRGSDAVYLSITELESAEPPSAERLVLVLGASIGGGMGFLLILLLLVCVLFHMRSKSIIEEYKTVKYLRQAHPDYKIDPERTLLEQCNDLPYDADWEFPEKRLILQEVLGSGAFGQVIKAEAIGILSLSARDKTSEAYKRRSRIRRRLSSSRLFADSHGNQYSRTTVAVKMLKENASESDYKDLASELKIMIHLGEHKNIINLLGACTRGENLMLILEYAKHGNLLQFLRTRRDIYEPTWKKTTFNPKTEFTLADQVVDAYQIAQGMDFLASKKCIHRDLAARNVLVDEGYALKIGDFGLARDIYKTDLYVKKGAGLLPVKWMAPEALFDREYSSKTDVWAFGVVLWEILTLGGSPYPGVPLEQLLDYINEGKRMAQPRDCPPEIYAIMCDCWSLEQDRRPTFAELVRRIERILEKKMVTETDTDDADAYISVFVENEGPKNYLEPDDMFSGPEKRREPKETTDDSNRYSILEAPLPPIPPPFLEDTQDSGDESAYCQPCDDPRTPLRNHVSNHVPGHVINKGKTRRASINDSPYSETYDDLRTPLNNHVYNHVHDHVFDEDKTRSTSSDSSAGKESGIGMDDDMKEDTGRGSIEFDEIDATRYKSRLLSSRESVV